MDGWVDGWMDGESQSLNHERFTLQCNGTGISSY